ncbi:MAG: helix-turn-helix transcriptional regulator [Patescibacteria group bacterium]
MNSKDEKTFKDLGRQLKEAREKAGLTQSELAEKAGVNANYYAVVERGEKNISYEKLQRILKVLNIKSLDIS